MKLSNKVLGRLYDLSPLGILVYTAEDFFPVDINRAASRMLGFACDELHVLKLSVLIHPDDISDVFSLIRRIASSELSMGKIHARLKTKVGEEVRAEIDVVILPVDEGEGELLVFMFQTTATTKAEEVLATRERTWRLAESIARLGLWRMHIETREIEWSDETYRIFEIPRGQRMCSATFLQIVHPDDRELVANASRSAVENRTGQDLVYRILCADKVKWIRQQCELEFDAIGRPVFIVGIIKDITAQTLARNQLEIKNNEVLQIMAALDESSLVTMVDTNGIIFRVNKRFCEVSKYRPDEIIGKNHNILNSGYHSKYFWREFWTTIRQGKVWRGDIKNRAKDGSFFWVNSTINPVRNEKNEITHYLTIRQDITARKIYEELLSEANVRLAHIEKFINFTTDAIQVCRLDGAFDYINDAASGRLGIGRDECHKFNISDVGALFSQSDWDQHVERLKKVGSINLEVSDFDRSKGTSFPAEVSMRYISVCAEDYVIIVSHDITERRRSESVLKESQSRLAEAQRMGKLGYWEIDLSTNLLWWSDEQYKINGMVKSEDALTQSDFIELLHPDDRRSFLEILDNVVSNREETSITYRIVRPDGEVRFLFGYASVILNETGKIIKLSGVNQDVTDRIMTENALRESETTLRKAQAVAKIGSWKLEVRSGMLEWSEETYNIFNIDLGKAITYEEFLSHVHPEDKELVDHAWKQALDGAAYDIVHRIIVNKKIKWVREQAELVFDGCHNLVYGFGIVQDITDQKALQDSNLIFNQSLLLTGLGSWRGSFRKRTLFMSDNVYHLHGLEKHEAEISFENYLHLIHPEDQKRFRRIILKVIVERGSFETEYRVEVAPGQIRWLSTKGKVLTDRDGEPMEMYGIVRDITAERNSTMELIEARRQAEEASLIKDEFLSVMSHEIRTPLNSVIGLSSLILKRHPREDQLEIMKVLKGSADNLLHLVNDILDFNKIRAGKLELEFLPFRLSVFLQHLYESFKLSALDKGIGFSIHTDTHIPDVLIGDVTRLSQILNNLVGNAIKFTNTGHVRFNVDLRESREHSCLLVFDVEDTGVGITPDKIGTIFQPFQQSERDTSRKYGGTGLGLSIVKSLVKILNGDITVRSIPGKGSVFSVVLEFSFSGAGALKQDMPDNILFKAIPKKQRPKLHVLYIEDVESNRFLIANLLSDHHIHTTSVSSGKSALQRTKARKFDLILMDIQMPGMDGYEATRRIRNQPSGKNNSTPVIAFTAEPHSEELRKKVAMHDMQELITKPFDANFLIDKIFQFIQLPHTEKDFSFRFYEDAFNHDHRKLHEIALLVIKDVKRFKTRLSLYDRKKHWQGMRNEIHRIRPILKKLECHQLLALLDKYRSDESPFENAQEITKAVNIQLGKLLTRLSSLRYAR